MRNLIKQILKEDDDLGWIKDIAPRLEVGTPLSDSNPKHIFRFHYNHMHGDADGYSEENIDVGANETDRLNGVLVASTLINAHKGNRDNYRDVFRELIRRGIKPWHLDGYNPYDNEDVDEDTLADWFSDMITDTGILTYDHRWDGYARLSGFYVTYFDESGVEHNVKINQD